MEEEFLVAHDNKVQSMTTIYVASDLLEWKETNDNFFKNILVYNISLWL
jgi:hypothetical protein